MDGTSSMVSALQYRVSSYSLSSTVIAPYLVRVYTWQGKSAFVYSEPSEGQGIPYKQRPALK